jgi:nucleoside-diphosphate-sugar epimerase
VRRILVTGASGFIGRAVVARLGAGDGAVHAASRCPGQGGRGRQVHRLDLLDRQAVTQIMAAVRPTHLLHLAWATAPGTYWTSPENLEWVEASLHLLREFARWGGARAVVAGSCAEYDWQVGPCREEETPLRPRTLYGTCKDRLRAAAEAFAVQAGMGLAWARVFFVYGPHEHPSRLVPSVIRALLRGAPAPCSSGTQRRDFLYVDDVGDALVTLLGAGTAGAVNVGSGAAVAVRDVVERIGALMARPELVGLGAPGEAADEPPLVVADVRRLHEGLGWSPRYDLEEGLTRTIAWWRERRETGDA